MNHNRIHQQQNFLLLGFWLLDSLHHLPSALHCEFESDYLDKMEGSEDEGYGFVAIVLVNERIALFNAEVHFCLQLFPRLLCL